MNAFADMGQFKVCPPYRTRETGQSFASRLASYFGCRSLKEFCLDYGLDYVDLQHGEREPLEKLAYMTGTDVETLVACTPGGLAIAASKSQAKSSIIG